MAEPAITTPTTPATETPAVPAAANDAAATPPVAAPPAEPAKPKPRTASQARAEAWEAGRKARGNVKGGAPERPAAAPQTPPAGEQKPEPGKAEPSKPEQPKPAERPELTADEIHQVRALVRDDPSALAALQEMIKHKDFAGAFISLKRQRAEVAQTKRELERERTERDAWRAEKEAEKKLARENPLELMRRYGVSVRQMAEREAAEDPPEKVAERERAERLDKLEKRFEEGDQTRQNEEREQAVLGAQRDIERRFLGATGKFQALRDYMAVELEADDLDASEEAVARNVSVLAWNLLYKHHEETGEELPLEDILRELDERADSRLNKLYERRSRSKDRRLPEETPGPSERGNGAGASPAKPGAPEAPTSLSSTHTAERGGDATPPKSMREARDRAWAAAEAARKR